MDDEHADQPLSFLGTPLPTWVQRREVAIESGAARPYDEREWRDALVIVEQGEVTLECTRGGYTTFRRGDILWLVDVPLRTMHNFSPERAVVVAVSRQRRGGPNSAPTTHEHPNHSRAQDTTMTTREPTTELDQRFSSDGAATRSWLETVPELADAEIFWLSTVRPDGRPHVTPLISVLIDESLHFCTGATEQKAKNLEQNPNVVMTTGNNSLNEGLDLVVEGRAVLVTDERTLQHAADLYATKYEGWHFDVRDGALHGDGGAAMLYQVRADKAFGFGKGEPYSQTRWTF